MTKQSPAQVAGFFIWGMIVRFKYAVGSTNLAGAVFVGVGLYSFGQAMKGFDMGPQPPGPW